ncbi:hypothetical protein BD309DRAFT_960170 [Dichomitus squalens]|nr:hypothetical protein BD309DRAFT_960170 [Dichomitus squalens]
MKIFNVTANAHSRMKKLSTRPPSPLSVIYPDLDLTWLPATQPLQKSTKDVDRLPGRRL